MQTNVYVAVSTGTLEWVLVVFIGFVTIVRCMESCASSFCALEKVAMQ